MYQLSRKEKTMIGTDFAVLKQLCWVPVTAPVSVFSIVDTVCTVVF